MENILLSIPDACAALSVKRTTLYRLINEGRLRTIKIGRRTLIPSTAIREFAESPPWQDDTS